MSRLRDERAGDRELLLLAAGERAGLAAAEVADDREELVDAPQDRARVAARPPRGEAEPQVLLDGQLGEDAPPLGHERNAAARDVLGRAAAKRAVAETRMSPPVTGAAPMIACSVDDLPAPFGPISPTISPGCTSNDRPRTASTPP